MPERGSVESFAAGNTNCHPHSFAAWGYFRANALCSSAWDVRSLHKLRAKQYWGKVGIRAAAASALPYAPSPCPSPTRGEGTHTRRGVDEGYGQNIFLACFFSSGWKSGCAMLMSASARWR